MEQDRILNAVTRAGQLLIESGAEVYRVEETMLHLCKGFKDVSDAQSYVSATGIMLNVTIDGANHTKIVRVNSYVVNLDRISDINRLSRIASIKGISVDELEQKLDEIENRQKYPTWVVILVKTICAGAFALYFGGDLNEVMVSAVVGLAVASSVEILQLIKFNGFFVNAISAAIMTLLTFYFESVVADISTDTVIISVIMLLVPGLAITNAIRDMFHSDYLSGLARACEAFLTAIGIASGVGFVLGMLL